MVQMNSWAEWVDGEEKELDAVGGYLADCGRGSEGKGRQNFKLMTKVNSYSFSHL